MKSQGNTTKWFLGMILLFVQACAIRTPDSGKSELPLRISANPGNTSELILYITGDGGWNNFSENLVKAFEREGFGVVSLNSLKYFRKEKTPQQFAHDLEFLASKYLKEWNKTNLVVVGYSFGADVSSFLPAHFSDNLKMRIERIALLSPSASTDFKVNINALLGLDDNEQGKYKIEPEIRNSELPVICIFGEKESLLLKDKLDHIKNISVFKLPGGHRYDNNYTKLIDIILK